MTDVTVATEILRQLGGNRFRAMTGAKNFTGHASALSFKLPSNFATKGVNYVKVTLTPADTYIVEFLKIRALKVTPIETVEDVYHDNLQGVFTRVTGLDTSLGRTR
jgi:hypothetical protein